MVLPQLLASLGERLKHPFEIASNLIVVNSPCLKAQNRAANGPKLSGVHPHNECVALAPPRVDEAARIEFGRLSARLEGIEQHVQLICQY